MIKMMDRHHSPFSISLLITHSIPNLQMLYPSLSSSSLPTPVFVSATHRSRICLSPPPLESSSLQTERREVGRIFLRYGAPLGSQREERTRWSHIVETETSNWEARKEMVGGVEEDVPEEDEEKREASLS